jgi:hypothetical protein
VVAGLAASAGVMALPISASEASREPQASSRNHGDHTLLALEHDLHRMRRRIGMLERQMRKKEALLEALCAERGIPLVLANGFANPEAEALRREMGRDAAWQAWSDAIGRAEQLADRMRRIPVESIDGLSARFDALHWALYHDRPDLFEARRLAAFGRELRAVARGAGGDRI